MKRLDSKDSQHTRLGNLDIAGARRAFIEQRLQKRDAMVFFLLLAVSYPFHIILLLVEPMVVPAELIDVMFTMHFVMIAAVSLMALGALFGYLTLNIMIILQVLIALVLAYVLRGAAVDHPEWLLTGSKLLTTTIVFELIFCAGHGPILLASLAGYLGIVVWGYAPYPDATTAMIVDLLTILGAFIGNLLILRETARYAGRDFDNMMKEASPHMVVKAALSGKSIQETFAARERFCVCISSDWREYQVLAATIDPKQLALAMTKYYSAISKILVEEIANGNFFTDWIADELFIVIYAEDEANHADLITAALDVALRVLETKREFYVRNGFPAAIDVGVAAGTALVGMLGPEDVAKPTALGDIPGRARRMEEAGKFLRGQRGMRDRIIFGRDVLTMIQEPRDIVECPLPADADLKNLADKTLFLFE